MSADGPQTPPPSDPGSPPAPGDPGSPWTRRRPPAEVATLSKVRPAWMVMLASLMTMVAFQRFMGALSDLEGAPANLPPPAVAGDAAPIDLELAAQQALGEAYRLSLAEVPAGAYQLQATLALAYASLLLFAVAAIATRDKRGRAVAMAAAWAGIVFNLANAAVFMLFVRPGILRRAPQWIDEVRALTKGSGQEAASSEMVDGWAQVVLLGMPVLAALLGVAFAVVVLVFFGGRRGRAYYGLNPTVATGAARTGA